MFYQASDWIRHVQNPLDFNLSGTASENTWEKPPQKSAPREPCVSGGGNPAVAVRGFGGNLRLTLLH